MSPRQPSFIKRECVSFVTEANKAVHEAIVTGGDKRLDNRDNNLISSSSRMTSLELSVIVLRSSSVLIAAFASGMVLQTVQAKAQWWSHAPADFEECADVAEKAATKDAKAVALTACNAKFAGRRKPGGGYTYYDFMQNRSFDIAGPNPTPQEQKLIDEQYTAFLDKERQNRKALVFDVRPAEPPLPQAPQLQLQQLPQPQQAALRNERVPLPVEAPNKRPGGAANLRPAAKCAAQTFSCNWPRLSEGIDGLKKLFGTAQGNPSQANASQRSSSPGKDKRGSLAGAQ